MPIIEEVLESADEALEEHRSHPIPAPESVSETRRSDSELLRSSSEPCASDDGPCREVRGRGEEDDAAPDLKLLLLRRWSQSVRS